MSGVPQTSPSAALMRCWVPALRSRRFLNQNLSLHLLLKLWHRHETVLAQTCRTTSMLALSCCRPSIHTAGRTEVRRRTQHGRS